MALLRRCVNGTGIVAVSEFFASVSCAVFSRFLSAASNLCSFVVGLLFSGKSCNGLRKPWSTSVLK